MGVVIQIRDVDEWARDRLKARAAQAGDSFNTYLRRILTDEASRMTQTEVFARARARSETADVPSADVIRAERDALAARYAAPRPPQ
ncbi:MAG TPA: hypothetical protein PLX71_02760 [Phycicoccus sp.]|nr:hypothetical protein [Phycicoccus sp.]